MSSETKFFLLSEVAQTGDFVDDIVFTDVTHDGEVYTSYRIIRVTHSIADHPDGWTHQANIGALTGPGLGVALLAIVDRIVEDSTIVTFRPSPD